MFSKHLWPSIKPSFSSFFNFFFVYSLLSLFFLCSYFFLLFFFCSIVDVYTFFLQIFFQSLNSFVFHISDMLIYYIFFIFFHFFREGCFFSFLISICFKLVIFYFVFMVFLLSYWVLWCLIKFKLNT